eukprot:12904362-Prorocentrum_lima.AAC.1
MSRRRPGRELLDWLPEGQWGHWIQAIPQPTSVCKGFCCPEDPQAEDGVPCVKALAEAVAGDAVGW